MVSLMFNDQKEEPVDIPSDVFGEGFRNFLIKEDMDMIISLKQVQAIVSYSTYGERTFAFIFYVRPEKIPIF